ncbi:DUF6380 family protein [Streptomyces antibioticus]|uniref:DUF6380 family protein n=1 Tax=Streptomyces antibioticus TaxID=1890 RepID=UPI0033C78FC7
MDATGDKAVPAGRAGRTGGKRHATLRTGTASLTATVGRAAFNHHGRPAHRFAPDAGEGTP